MALNDYSSFTCEVVDGIARITLNTPDRGNPIDGLFCKEFNALATALSDRSDVRVVLIAAKGRMFSVGGDIDTFVQDRAGLPLKIKTWAADLHVGLARIARMPAPVIAVSHGATVGGAVALVASADFVFAAKSARFTSAFAKIGYSCDSGSSIALARRMGVSRAKRFLILAETLSAEEALSTGLVDWVTEDDQCLIEAEKLAATLAKGATAAYGEIKQLMATVNLNNFETQLEDEAQALARMAKTDDAWEGLTAFKEKRAPRFTGK